MHARQLRWYHSLLPSLSKRLVISLIGILALLTAVTWGSLALAGSSEPRAASDDQVTELTDVFRRYERTFFEAMVSGDPTHLSEILYNDPTVELQPELIELSARYHDKVKEILQQTAMSAPIGSATGFLSAQIAYVANMNFGIEAWKQEQEKARQESREASPVHLPPGATPFQRPAVENWIPDVPVQVLNVKIGGNHATADIVFVESELLADYLNGSDPYMQHYTFTNVDGQWYISNIWSKGNI